MSEAVSADEGRANRDRWHWKEVELLPWLRKWCDLNLDELVLLEDSSLKFRTRNTYKDNDGECLLHARKGKVFATYNVDLVIKWYAQRRLDGRVVGEARGRVNVREFASQGVEVSSGDKNVSAEAPDVADALQVQGDWEYGRGVNAMQGPGTDDVAKAEAAKAASSDVERFLKAEFSEKALPALRSRLRALHSALADLAASREEAPDAPLPEPVKLPALVDSAAVARAESSTRDFIAGVKQKLRPPEFLTKLESLGGAKELSLRSNCLGDADVLLIVDALAKGADLLEKMDLSYNDITDVGLQALIVSLATGAAPKLTKLVVEQTKVSDIGKRMVAGLQMMRKDIMTSL